jgi:predicted RNA-binding protein associated with RNAse of E/G family
VTQGDTIRLHFPGKRYEVSLFYETGTGPARPVQYYFPGIQARFYGWKVDITSPFARTALGFDIIDEVLDICVRPDRTFDWRDQDEMSEAVRLGIYTEAEAQELYAVGYEVEALIRAHAPPFDEEWQTWRPDADLLIGAVPEGWQYLPVPAPYRAWTGPLA